MRRFITAVLLLGTMGTARAGGEDFSAEQVAQGAMLYRQLCQQCHGHALQNSGGSTFDLRRFPRDDKARFVTSVTEGRNEMPPWDDVLEPEDVDALWAYVVATQRKAAAKAGQ